LPKSVQKLKFEAQISTPRPEYVPPRAFAAYHTDDDDVVNKGCFYFMACLDSLWAL
jgi:hypothetical protein